VGLGASSYVFGRRFHSERDLGKYMDIRIHEDLTPLYQEVQELTEEDKMEEFMYLGLRMMKGVSGSDFMYLFGQNMFNAFAEPIKKNIAMHLLQEDAPYLKLTEKGIDVSNRVFADFYEYLPREKY
jgi:oxygen-independent coproporphyrinogen-3 oxidase